MKKFTLVMISSLLLLATLPAQTVLTKAEKTHIEQQTMELAKAYQELDIFSGVILLAQDGKPFYQEAFGLANRSENIKNTRQTVFDIGSMNKSFTKAIILQLISEGNLKIDDTLGKYLDGFDDIKSNQITIEHLLNHTSGFGDYFTPDMWDIPAEKRTIDWVVERARELPLFFEPGDGQEYSNTGYVLLGAIIEKATAKSYYEQLRNRILKPLGMKNTYIEDVVNLPNRAVGYLKNPFGEIQDNNMFTGKPKPDGGFFATAEDVLTFYQHYFYDDTFVPTSAKEGDRFYAFVESLKDKEGYALPIAGGHEGANSVLYEMPSRRISIIVLANMDEPVAEQLGEGILHIINGKEPAAPALPARQQVYQAFLEHGGDYVKKHFDELTTNFHPTDPKDLILNNVGYNLLGTDQVDKAIEIFTLNTELFPDAANCYDSLAEAWLEKGNKEKALELYKKALELDPQLPSAQQMVKELSH